MFNTGIWHIFLEMEQNEKLKEIKSPLISIENEKKASFGALLSGEN